MELWELSAREEIRALVASYNSLADRGRFDETLALFAPSARMVTPFGDYRGRDEIAGVFSGAQDQASAQVPAGARPHVRHHIATHHIELLDADRATGRCYFSVMTPVGLDHWGHYVDEYADDGDGWCFTSRIVRVDGQHRESLFPRSVPDGGPTR